MAGSIEQQNVEAVLIFSTADREKAKTLLKKLNDKGYRITPHRNLDEDYLIDRPAYDNMTDVMKRSKAFLIFFTCDTVDKCSLEMKLVIEKSMTERKRLQLIVDGLSDDQLDSVKQGLLGVVPHIFINMHADGWDEILLNKLRAPVKMIDELLPVGNLAHGQVFSHYVGYLQYILPGVQESLERLERSSDFQRNNPGRFYHKYIMLIPYSCNTDISIEGFYPDCDVTINHVNVDEFSIRVVHGEKRREFKLTLYRASKRENMEPIFFIGESVKALGCISLIKTKRIANVDTNLEAFRFYHTMTNLLNHPESRCMDTTKLLLYEDDASSIGKVLWTALNEPTDSGVNLPYQPAARRIWFEPNVTDNYEYDATVSCICSSDAARTAQTIIQFLRRSGKTVNELALNHRAFTLDQARWNIIVLSRHAFEGEYAFGLDLLAAVERCARNKCMQTLPVITGYIKREDVPDPFKSVAVSSQEGFEQTILDQIDGKLAHLQQKMPVGDVSTGLAWAYLLNYLPIQLGERTVQGNLDFKGRIKKHLADKGQNCGCLPYFYVILSSTGVAEKLDVPGVSIFNLGRAEPPITMDQAGTKGRQYYINMYKYRFPDGKEVCFISEACTPGVTIHTMATDDGIQFAGIEQAQLTDHIEKLAQLITELLSENHYKTIMGDYTNIFRLIRPDKEGRKSLPEMIERQLKTDMDCSELIYANRPVGELNEAFELYQRIF